MAYRPLLFSQVLWHQLQTPPLPYWSVLVRDAGSDRYAYSPWAYISVALLIFSLGLVASVEYSFRGGWVVRVGP